tara:strand:+ start:1867 stop:4230 length:2364 start_codon:yes stop_codon:yes gene_type:complete
MESYLTDEKLADLESEFVEFENIDRLIDLTEKGYDADGKLLYYFIKDVFTDDELKPLEPTIDLASTFIVSNGRGSASGKLDMSNPLWAKSLRNLKLEEKHIHNKYTLNPEGVGKRKMKLSNPVYSNIVGYYDKQLIPKKKEIPTIPKCRLTQFSSRYFLKYQTLIPYVEKLSSIMKNHCPDEYKRQKEFVEKTAEHIGESCYSTITINKNFRTAIHIDKGDYKEGIGTITTMGNFTGGQFCLPEYRIGFNLTPKDILFVNVHKHHGNLPFEGTRYSMVSYAREHLNKCGLRWDYKVAICSKGRSQTILDKTLTMLSHINPSRIYIFVIESEYEDYKYLEDYLDINIVIGVDGQPQQREFVSNYFNEGQPIVWCDDDCDMLKRLLKPPEVYTKENGYFKEIENYEKFFLDGFTEMNQKNLNLYGVYPLRNSGWMKDRTTESLKYIIGAFNLTFNKRECEKLEADYDYHLCEDFVRTLKYFKSDGGVLRNESVYIKHNTYTLEGGIDRKGGKLDPLKAKQHRKFCEENSEFCRIKVKKDTIDIAFKRRDRFNPKKEIIASFWHGVISEKQIKSINSYLDKGYEFHLYSYDKINIPNVKMIDASELMSKELISEFPHISSFSDFFRYKMIYETGKIWTDLDMICLQDIPQRKIIISSEEMLKKGAFKSNKGYKVCICFLKLPKGDIMLKAILEWIVKNKDKLKERTQLQDIFDKYCELFNYYQYVSPPNEFCPISWCYAKEAMDDEKYASCPVKFGIEKKTIESIKENAICFHFWNNITKDCGIENSSFF